PPLFSGQGKEDLLINASNPISAKHYRRLISDRYLTQEFCDGPFDNRQWNQVSKSLPFRFWSAGNQRACNRKILRCGLGRRRSKNRQSRIVKSRQRGAALREDAFAHK